MQQLSYWIGTTVLCVALLWTGVSDLALRAGTAVQMQHLGFPDHFTRLMGTWKLLAVIALLAPGYPRVKEWAYAGVFFVLTGAMFSHFVSRDPAGTLLLPAGLLLLWLMSYVNRAELSPAS